MALRQRHLAAFALHAALRFCSYAIHVAAPVPHGAMTLRPLPHRSTALTSRYPRCCVCTRAPIALWRWMLSPLLSHLSHLRSAAMGAPESPESDRFPQRHRLEAVPENPETKNLLGLQLFCDYGLLWVPLIANQDAKAQVICCKAAIVRFLEAEKSP